MRALRTFHLLRYLCFRRTV